MPYTDTRRLQYLLEGGYLPIEQGKDLVRSARVVLPGFPATGTDTEQLDWYLAHSYGPAYWRSPETRDERYECLQAQIAGKGNGLVFVRHCDRERIDGMIAEDGFRFRQKS